MKSSSIIHSKRYLTLTQANKTLQKYNEAAEQANKNSELEAQIKKVQDSLEKEKEKSYQEF